MLIINENHVYRKKTSINLSRYFMIKIEGCSNVSFD